MRTGTSTSKLLTALLALPIAVALAVSPVGPHGPVTASAFGAPQVGPGQNTAPNRNRNPSGNRNQSADNPDVDPVTGDKVENTSVVEYINAIYVWVAFIGGLLAVVSLMYAGYSYMGSYGDPEKIASAKDIVEKSLIGLSLLILAALILNTINPRTVSDPCNPQEPGCGDIDFTKPGGGVPNQ